MFQEKDMQVNDDSSSDSEEENRRLEAIDHSFLGTTCNSPLNMQLNSRKTHHRVTNQMADCEEPGLMTGFQKFIAKKLNQILESQIRDVDRVKTTVDENGINSQVYCDDGIRLFSSSKTTISHNSSASNAIETRKRKSPLKPDTSSDDEEQDERIASAAVSSQWVLEKRGVFDGETSQLQIADTNVIAAHGKLEKNFEETKSNSSPKKLKRKKKKKKKKHTNLKEI